MKWFRNLRVKAGRHRGRGVIGTVTKGLDRNPSFRGPA